LEVLLGTDPNPAGTHPDGTAAVGFQVIDTALLEQALATQTGSASSTVTVLTPLLK